MKKHYMLVLSALFAITEVPDNNQVLLPFIISAVKTNPSETYVYDLLIILCANVVTQSATLEDSYSPRYISDILRITIAIAAAFNLSLSLLDVVNAYQNAILYEEKIA